MSAAAPATGALAHPLLRGGRSHRGAESYKASALVAFFATRALVAAPRFCARRLTRSRLHHLGTAHAISDGADAASPCRGGRSRRG